MSKTLLHIAVFVCLILSTSAHAQNLTIRLRGILISPDESSTISINGEAGASNTVVPELDFTYFFTNNIGVELILATSKHDMTANGTDVGDVDLGSVWLLPPYTHTAVSFHARRPDQPLRRCRFELDPFLQ